MKAATQIVTHSNQPYNPFELTTPWQSVPGVGSLIQDAATHALALAPLKRVYEELVHCQKPADFAGKALEVMGVRHDIDNEDLSRIPTTGPAIVVANHPYGGLDGLLLMSLLLQRRGDVRLLANHLLWRIPELRPILIPIDVLDPTRKTANLSGLRTAIAHVKSGGLLATFPAGAVSHLHLKNRHVLDPQWSGTAVRLIRKCNAPVTPMYFAGHNSAQFQFAGLIHPLLRTALLPRELINKRNHQIQVKVGNPIPASQIDDTEDDISLANLLRLRTYALAKTNPYIRKKPLLLRKQTTQVTVAQAIAPSIIAAELEALPITQQLLETNGLKVVYAQASQLPWTLQELGRLRELSFRGVGEGTGQERDIDLFDNYYTQLICWNPKTSEIVGGYRIGAVDNILQHFGLRGLYTQSLFKFNHALFEQPEMAYGKALELGRSFVREEYQRSFTPLLSLWRGLCTYVAKHPQYRILFGPVSISNDYLPASRLMLVDFLKQHHLDHKLARFIKPRTQLRRRHPLAGLSKEVVQLSDLDTFSTLLSQIEPDQKGVPVLLRQYIKFGGRLLGFNLDTQFGDVIDGLIMVDLSHTELKTLQRYMGKEEALAYIGTHPH